MKNKKKKYNLRDSELTSQRNTQIEDGYFDGRFNERKQVPKKQKDFYKKNKKNYIENLLNED